MKRGRWLLAGIATGLVVICGAVALAWKPALPLIPPPAAASFDHAVVMRGDGLARIGGCITCHTARDGSLLAGGRPLDTPFGTIFATNITPDPETGIGRWSREAFARAMRDGVARDGTHLYPAFPYDHFRRLSDSDLDALYAFLMSRPAVSSHVPANRLIWPLDYRPIMAAWNLLYLPERRSDDADRGRYLAEGLAHCGACHTPRNSLGAERAGQAYDGGWSEGWYAPALNSRSPAKRPWTTDELFAYLRTGFSAAHSAAAGPMAEVTHQLAEAPESEVRAIADYFARSMAKSPNAQDAGVALDKRESAGRLHPEGATLFAGACAACHEAGAPMMQQGRPPLAWGTPLQEGTPHDTLHVIVSGVALADGRAGPAMPAFGDDFTDRQLAEIAAYLRARYTDLQPWQNVEQVVADVRREAGR